MRISKIDAPLLLPNYKDVSIAFSRVNIFVGPNNAGKTKLLQLLHAGLCSAFGRTRNYDPNGIINLFRHENRAPKIEYQVDDSVKPVPGFKGGLADITAQCFNPDSTLRFKFINTLRQFSSSFNTREADETRLRTNELTNAADLMPVLAANPKLRPVLVYEIRKLFGVKLTLEEVGWNLALWAQGNSGPRISFDQQGQGIQDYLALFFYLYHPNYKIILIDEPENNLHPQLQRVFIRRLREIVEEQDKQVFLTSHSPFMVLPTKIEDLEGVFLMRPHDPTPRVTPLASLIPPNAQERKTFESYLPNVDAAIAELFFARAALIVEGPTDRQLLKYLASRTHRDPHELDISIIESNGLGLMPELIRIAKNIVPHWRAVVDSDLLTIPKKRFTEYRDRMAAVLGLPNIPCSDTPETRQLLSDACVDALPGPGIETLYKSQEASECGHLEHVEPDLKGWLMEREIARIAELNQAQIEADYEPLLRPLESLRATVKALLPEGPSLAELACDDLQDEGLKIHRIIFRNRLTKQQLGEDDFLHQLLSGYTIIDFKSHDDYSLSPIGLKVAKISCMGPEVRVVELTMREKIMVRATVEEPTSS